MKAKLSSVIIFAIVTLNAFSQEIDTLQGVFKYSEIANEYVNTNDENKAKFILFLDSLNIDIIDQYYEMIERTNYKPGDSTFNFDDTEIFYHKADSILATDSILKGMSGRVVSIFYTMYVVKNNDMLDLHCIHLDGFTRSGTQNIYLTKEQLNRIKPKLGKEMELKIQYITEAKWTKYKIYRLLE